MSIEPVSDFHFSWKDTLPFILAGLPVLTAVLCVMLCSEQPSGMGLSLSIGTLRLIFKRAV
ncbi:hypothetical protein D3C85_1829100 [compost metagenome]